MSDKPNVLVIDDEQIICISCRQILEQIEMSVDCAENGIIGLAQLQEKAYDIVLIDLMMPQMSGMEVLDAIRKLNQNIVAIVITGFATIESAVEAVQKGAYDYIPKPFTPNELRNVVRKGLERRKLLQETTRLRQEREQHLTELAAEQSRLRTIINCMGEGLIATDRDGNLLLINSVACRLLEIKNHLQTGYNIRDKLNNKELEDWIFDILKENKFPQEFINTEIVFNENEGKFYSITLAPIKENEDQISGLVLVLMDISEEKKLAKRKIEFQKLVSIVTHELKAPINTIEGYLDIIIKGYVNQKPEKLIEYLERSRGKAETLRNLIQDLLSITSIESGKITKQMKPVNIRPILMEIMIFMENEVQSKNITLNNELQDQLPLIVGDKTALNYLFSNLIINAVKYNKISGSVTIKAEINDDYIILSVTDTGHGISENELDKIFDEFYRSGSKIIQTVPGTGLGLNIAKRIAELHNGCILVKSTLNKGSEFQVHLPILKMI